MQFKSNLFTEVGKALGMHITGTSGYNPKGNGQVERMHRELNNILLAMVHDDPQSWEDALPAALFALQTTPCSSTGLTPYQILFGRDVSQLLDTILGCPEDYLSTNRHGATDAVKYATHLKKRRTKSHTC